MAVTRRKTKFAWMVPDGIHPNHIKNDLISMVIERGYAPVTQAKLEVGGYVTLRAIYVGKANARSERVREYCLQVSPICGAIMVTSGFFERLRKSRLIE